MVAEMVGASIWRFVDFVDEGFAKQTDELDKTNTRLIKLERNFEEMGRYSHLAYTVSRGRRFRRNNREPYCRFRYFIEQRILSFPSQDRRSCFHRHVGVTLVRIGEMSCGQVIRISPAGSSCQPAFFGRISNTVYKSGSHREHMGGLQEPNICIMFWVECKTLSDHLVGMLESVELSDTYSMDHLFPLSRRQRNCFS